MGASGVRALGAALDVDELGKEATDAVVFDSLCVFLSGCHGELFPKRSIDVVGSIGF